MTPTSLGLLPPYPPEHAWRSADLDRDRRPAALGRCRRLLLTASWRWIFIVNVPIGLAALVVGWRMLPRVRDTTCAA